MAKTDFTWEKMFGVFGPPSGEGLEIREVEAMAGFECWHVKARRGSTVVIDVVPAGKLYATREGAEKRLAELLIEKGK